MVDRAGRVQSTGGSPASGAARLLEKLDLKSDVGKRSCAQQPCDSRSDNRHPAYTFGYRTAYDPLVTVKVQPIQVTGGRSRSDRPEYRLLRIKRSIELT